MLCSSKELCFDDVFTNLRLTSNLFALCAAAGLVADVALAHQHSITICTAAAFCLVIATISHLLVQLSCTDEHQKLVAWVAAKDTTLTIFNLVALDTFLYEETTYNFFGHSSNELKQERNLGAVLEIGVAVYIVWTVHKQYRNVKSSQESYQRVMV